MKHFLVLILALFCIVSCEKTENEKKSVVIDEETITAKWNVSSTSDFESFEFTESGNYIVIKKSFAKTTGDPSILFGSYEIVDNKTINLSDFGTITVTKISGSIIGFKVQLFSDTENEIAIEANKQEAIEKTERTELLCRTWELVSCGGYSISDFTVLFSKAGTYFLSLVLDGERISATGTWVWCDSEQTKLAFAMEESLDCESNNVIKEIQLTEDSFTGIDLENGEPQTMIMRAYSSEKVSGNQAHSIGKTIFGFKK